MLSKILPCFLLASTVALNAQAEGFYARIDSGISMTKKLSDGTSEEFYGGKKAKHGAIYGFGVGYQFNDKLRMDLNVAPRKHKFSRNSEKRDQVVFEKSTFKQDITVNAIMLNGYYDIIEHKGMIPYLTVGAGIAENKGGIARQDGTKFDMGLVNKTAKGRSLKKKSTRNFVWNVGIGTSYSFTDKLSLDLGFKYLDLGRVKTFDEREVECFNASGVPAPKLNVSNIESIAKLRVHSFTVGLRYKF